MDYEFRIKLAEKELAHLRDMQEIQRQRQDTTDARFEAIERLLFESVQLNKQTAENLAVLTAKFDTLIEALGRQPRNGH